ncbi:hypothetical protein ACHAXM_007172 [Skeletonema potamos]
MNRHNNTTRDWPLHSKLQRSAVLLPTKALYCSRVHMIKLW